MMRLEECAQCGVPAHLRQGLCEMCDRARTEYLHSKRRVLRRHRRRELIERLAQPAIVAGVVSALISLACWIGVLFGGGR